MRDGWIKLHRQLKNCWIWEDKEPFDRRSAWVDLLLLARHKDAKMLNEGEIITIRRGSYMTSVVKLSERWKWSRGKTDRFLKLLEKEQMINTSRTPFGTLVTIVKYEDFQSSETTNSTTVSTTYDTEYGTTSDTTLDTANGQPTDRQRTANDTTVDTQNKNVKNIENDKEQKNEKKERMEEIKRIVEYLNQKCGTKYRTNNRQTQEHINARFNDGYAEEDFYTVIDKKVQEWQGTEMEKFLRPITLFNTKFESYLNQNVSACKGRTAQMLENHYSMVDDWVRRKEMEARNNDI